MSQCVTTRVTQQPTSGTVDAMMSLTNMINSKVYFIIYYKIY